MRSPTCTYAEGGNRWVYVSKTQVPPPEFYGRTRRSFKFGMITTIDPSDGEDMYVDSTDVESPSKCLGPVLQNFPPSPKDFSPAVGQNPSEFNKEKQYGL